MLALVVFGILTIGLLFIAFMGVRGVLKQHKISMHHIEKQAAIKPLPAPKPSPKPINDMSSWSAKVSADMQVWSDKLINTPIGSSFPPIPPIPPLPKIQLPKIQPPRQHNIQLLTRVSTNVYPASYDNKRLILEAFPKLQVPKSTYIRHYINNINDKDELWKEDFLAFCKKNNIDIGEDDLDNGLLLI
jgi:hypothetical protein